jgi:hypothetical protein
MSVAALLSNVLDAGSTPAISTNGPFRKEGLFCLSQEQSFVYFPVNLYINDRYEVLYPLLVIKKG